MSFPSSRVCALAVWALVCTAGCVAKDCPAGSARVDGKCVASGKSAVRGDEHADAGAGGPNSMETEVKDAGMPRLDAATVQMDAAAMKPATDAAEAHAADAGHVADAGGPKVDAGPCDGGDSVACWRDYDGDGYAEKSASMERVCGSECPKNWTATEPKKDAQDCDDRDDLLHPKVDELCDGVDQDCDGEIDEDADSNCKLANATAVCQEGTCRIASCDKGYDSCDAKHENGCEASLTSVTACGACGVTCDPRADCGVLDGSTAGPACACRAPLSGDGMTCRGQGPFTLGGSTTSYVCGLRTDGSMECVGSAPTQTTTHRFVQIAGQQYSVCGIRKDNAHIIECWGNSNNYGQLGSPDAGARDVETKSSGAEFVQVVASLYHACGLLSDGTAKCWGAMNAASSAGNAGQATVPPDVQGNLRQLAAGTYHTCALTKAGKATCWGAGKSSCGTCTSPDYGQSVAPYNDSFVEITAGDLHTCGLRSDGSVRCWGAGATKGSDPYYGQAAPPQSSHYLQISAGMRHTCGVTSQHNVECWGDAPSFDTAGADHVYAGTLATCELFATGSGKLFQVGASQAINLAGPWMSSL